MKKNEECQQLVTTLSDYVDGTLDESLCEVLERHLEECENCQIVVNTLKKTVELYRMTPCEDVPEDVRERLYTRLNLVDYLKS